MMIDANAIPANLPKRDRLILAAQSEMHGAGYAATSLAAIAEAADVPLGNVYYYFKTKDALVKAVVDEHVGKMKEILETAGEEPTPKQRLSRFVQEMKTSAATVADHGCPLACLNQDLGKAGGDLQREADRLFARQLSWFEEQFKEAGHEQAARGLAVHMLARTQGASSICQTLRDGTVFCDELDRLADWVEEAV